MVERVIHTVLLVIWFLLAMLVFRRSFAAPAPYGRYARDAQKSSIASRWGWVIMECPTVIVVGVLFVLGPHNDTPPAYALLAMWMAHYLQRTFLYPFLRRDLDRRMPSRIVATGAVFNVLNGYLNGRFVFSLSGGYPDGWLADPRFIVGAAVYLVGYAINRHADFVLHRLRRDGGDRYRVPEGGLYRWVSCPNYLGEIVEWTGWAIATWSLAGLAFAFWTAANLAPRAWFHHRWYLREFADYPRSRRALLPGLW
jgi:protein-S-isoprenylcysteine O-methyltransferase Ste14